MAASPVTGEAREIRLGPGVIRHREVGGGPTLLILHGILANGILANGILANGTLCLVEALGLRDVTLVGKDKGGAIWQIVVAEHPGRVGRLVLTNFDGYEVFFPTLLAPFQYGARFFGTRFVDLLALSFPGFRRPVPIVWGEDDLFFPVRLARLILGFLSERTNASTSGGVV